MNFNVKRRIRVNGREFSDPKEMPPEIRAAYEQALRKASEAGTGVIKKKIVINGQQFDQEHPMPIEVEHLFDDVMSVIENNGEVTLPEAIAVQTAPAKRQWTRMVAIGAGVFIGAGLRLLFR